MTELQWASDLQREAFHYGPWPMCLSGGFTAGKTWGACLKALWLSDAFPRNRGLIFRSVGKELRLTTMATFFKLCAPQAYARGKRNDQDGVLRLNNGSEILFMHLENPDIQGVLKGLEINWFLGDQLEEDPEHMEDIFDILLARLGRWEPAQVPEGFRALQEQATGIPWQWHYPDGRPQPPPYAMITCNPDTELHWIYKRFHPESPEHQQTYAKLGYKMFEMDSEENRFLADVNRQALLAHDETFIRRYVRGTWGLPEGAIHTIDPRSIVEGSYELLDWIRSTCTLHRVLDHGDSSPTCCLWYAVDRDTNVWVYREYYLPNALISTHRANITSLSEYERYGSNYADPSIHHKMMQKHGGRWSVADEYSDTREAPADTSIFWSAADNNELGTRNRVSEYLRVDPQRVHPVTKALGAPRLFFVKANPSYPQGCVHTIRETRSQRRVRMGTDLGRPVYSDERDPSIVDHAYDCVRYAIASRPPIAASVSPEANYRTFFGRQQQLAKRQASIMSRR